MINGKKPHNFLLVSILPQSLSDEDALVDLKELKTLVEAYGAKVCDLIVQRREIHDKGTYIGRGKIKEVAAVVKEKRIDVIVLNAAVRPGQIFEMKNQLGAFKSAVHVWDKIDLILHIFASHAHTAEAKLQIELAKMRHMGPRIYGMGEVLSRQAGGIGTLGIGETNTELMKRHWRDQMKKVRTKLQKHAQDRTRQLQRRSKNGMRTVSIIGYTNAGKTSLFNLLTKKKNPVKNALFVTLDSSVGTLYLSRLHTEVVISDTIGFINDLPTSLLDAFKSTLLESVHADVLLHVIDASDSDYEKKIRTVERIVNELDLESKKRIYVFNKIDMMREKTRWTHDASLQMKQVYVSVREKKGIEQLLQSIEDTLMYSRKSELRKKRVHFPTPHY